LAPRAEVPAEQEPPKEGNSASVTPIVELRVAPYAEVFVDGERLGVTPLGRHLKLRPGRHTLKLVNKELGKTKELILDVKPGPNSLLKVDMLED
jgi:serine/threonine-protein kinase